MAEERRCGGCGRKFRGTTALCFACTLKPPKVRVDVTSLELREEFEQNYRALLQLCHPDKHANSEMSRRVTAWLLTRSPRTRTP